MRTDQILQFLQERRQEMLEILQRMVEHESPSTHPPAVNCMAEFVAGEAERLGGQVKLHRSSDYGHHLQADFEFPDGGLTHNGRLLVLGHMDTVWDVGTLPQMPFRIKNGCAYGPGVYDMKAGIAGALFALAALRALRAPVRKRVTLLLVSDEEVGSPSSRALTEKIAAACEGVLIPEPSAGPGGALKTARKGVGQYRVVAHGRGAHAGLDFPSGVNANVELARQVARVAGFTQLTRGITVNVGVMGGGTRENVVPDRAWANVDVRISRVADWKYVVRRFDSLRPFHPQARLEVSGELNRPPMERTAAIAALFEKARELARPLGMELVETSAGGGSDGNFTAALGVPTLDGLGAVGDGAHAAHEHVVVEELPKRSALMAHLLLNL
jgi:glutamate carboxypeptidase